MPLFQNLFKKRKKQGGEQQASTSDTRKEGEKEEDAVFDELEQNEKRLKAIFRNSIDLIVYRFESESGVQAMTAFIDGIVDKERLSRDIMPGFLSEMERITGKPDVESLKRALYVASLNAEEKMADVVEKILSNHVAIFVEGLGKALVVELPSPDNRNIEEPQSEVVSRGPREGFVENISTNRMLLRRIARNPGLIIEKMTLGRQTQTEVNLAYIDGLYNPGVLKELKKRLSKIDIDAVLDSGYVQGLIKDRPFSPYNTVGITERPDVVVGKLLEGRIAILCNGSPVALTVPHLFLENFQASEDYYNPFVGASLMRMLRYVSFVITILTPGLYVALVTHHQAMLPTKLLFSFISAREGVPFPTIIEVISLMIAFEILKETGVRMPKAIGQTISIVGALVLGQAAVEARFVSAPVVIIVAVTGITSFFFYQINGAVIMTRFLITILSASLGLYGTIFGVIIITLHIISLTSFGIPYVGYIGSLRYQEMKDTVIRGPWWLMNLRPKALSPYNQRRRRTR
jgi:spore germination protein KA